jgi:hypothetical protein
MKKLSFFGAFRFSEFRIRDCVSVIVFLETSQLHEAADTHAQTET